MRNLLLIAISSLAILSNAIDIEKFKHDIQNLKKYGHKDEKPETTPSNADCPDHTHKVTSLPYWNVADTLPCMYAGTFKASTTNDHNLFYWHFKNTSLTGDSPLVLWINGGPGSSSMFGLFLENGPLRVTRNGTGDDDFIIGLHKDGSWLDNSDIVFLDQPVGTGFSYGDSYLTDMKVGAQEFVNFLDAFLKEYTEYQGRPFYITGESYAGKYIPLFANYVWDYEHNQKGLSNLTAVMIGNPYASPLIQRTSTYKVGQALGIVDSYNYDQIAALRRSCEETLSSTFSTTAGSTCEMTMDYVDEVGGGVFTYDARRFDYDWAPVEAPYMAYLNKSGKIQELFTSIHIDQSTKEPKWESGSEKVSEGYATDQMVDYINYYDWLITSGIQTLVYAGQWDSRDGPTTIEPWLQNLKNLKGSNLWTQDRKIYYYQDSDGSQKVGGYYRYDANKNFTFLTVSQAGHFVPADRLAASKQFISDILNNGHLLCHGANATSCNTATIMCNYMNNCNNHGTCQTNGQCSCNSGYRGADCSEKVEALQNYYNKKFSVNGTQWIFFQYTKGLYYGQTYNFTLSSSQPLDIYILQGDNDPNEFNFDVAFKQQNYVQLSFAQFPFLSTFTAAVRINGIDFYSNRFYVSSVQAKFDLSQITSTSEQQRNLQMENYETVAQQEQETTSTTEEGEQPSDTQVQFYQFLGIVATGFAAFIFLFMRKSSASSKVEKITIRNQPSAIV